MRVVFFLLSIHKIVWPADADKIANLAQHPKSLGTATVKQCSAINNLSIASALRLSKSGLCNFKFCVALGSMQKMFFSFIWVLLLPVMPFKLTMFLCDCITANFTKDFSWISRRGSMHWANFEVLNLATIHVESFGSFGLPGSFFYQTMLFTSVTEPLGNIMPWDKNVSYQCCLLTKRPH